jgi:hypothetical protein
MIASGAGYDPRKCDPLFTYIIVARPGLNQYNAWMCFRHTMGWSQFLASIVKKNGFLYLLSGLAVVFLCACQNGNNGSQTWPQGPAEAGIRFSPGSGGLEGFKTYMASPAAKAFAAAPGKDGYFYAWGKG